MSAGDLRERIAFEARQTSDDGAGNVLGTFVEQFRRPAKIMPMKGREEILAARLTGINPVTITVRYDSKTRSVKPEWRIRDARTGEYYNIRAISNADMRHRFLEMTCEAGPAT